MKGDIKSKKKELRRIILAQRDALSVEGRRKKSDAIHTYLFSLPEFVAATTIAFFVSFKSEVLTDSMITKALALGKVVAVPLTDLRNKTLLLSRINDYPADLASGTWGILEPKPDCVRPIALEEVDLVITPGVAFDYQGHRIGYGGGFYDALIKTSRKRGIFVGLAFKQQVIREVPYDSDHDQSVDILITEEGVIHCRE